MGKPLVSWQWLALPNGISFKGAWDFWDKTRLHMSLETFSDSDWDDATMIAFCGVFAEKWCEAKQVPVDFRTEYRFHKYWWITRCPILHCSPCVTRLEQQRQGASVSALLDTGPFMDSICQLLGVLALTLRDARYHWPLLHLQTIRDLHFTSDLPADSHLQLL